MGNVVTVFPWHAKNCTPTGKRGNALAVMRLQRFRHCTTKQKRPEKMAQDCAACAVFFDVQKSRRTSERSLSMLFVVLAQNEFGLRDAWYVNADDLVEAMSDASERIISTGTYPETVTVLPAKDNRVVPYLFPNDPDTDAELVVGFLRGYIRTVLMDYNAFCDLAECGGYTAKRRAERLATDTAVCAETMARIFQFHAVDEMEQTKE